MAESTSVSISRGASGGMGASTCGWSNASTSMSGGVSSSEGMDGSASISRVQVKVLMGVSSSGLQA